MKEKIKKVVLNRGTWFIIGGLSINNLFFTGGNFEIDNEWYEYVLAALTGSMLLSLIIVPFKVTKLYDKIFK